MPSKGLSKSDRRVSKKQLQFLEYLVWNSKDADDFTKKCLIFLIRKSRGLTKPVGIIFSVSNRKLARTVLENLHDMCSSLCTTHINELFYLVGSNFSVDYGGLAIHNCNIKQNIYRFKPSPDMIEAVEPADPYKR